MASTAVGRRSGPRDLLDWFDFPGIPWLRRSYPIKIEEFVDGNRFVVRAEMPGLDPEKNLGITVGHGMLRIHAERHEEIHDQYHSELWYGDFERALALPEGAKEDTVTARYTNGMLEVSLEVTEPKAAVHKVPIETGKK